MKRKYEMTMNFTNEELEAAHNVYVLITNKMNDALVLLDEGDEASEIKAHQAAVDAFIEFIENVLGRSRYDFLGVTKSIRRLFRDDTPEEILNYHDYNCAFVKVLEGLVTVKSN
jgi:hypothetical protein